MIVKAAEKMEFAVVPSGLFGWIVKGRKKMKALAMAKVAAVIVALLGVLAGAVAAEVPAPVPSDMGTYAALTKRDIQTAIEAKVKSIRNFAVTFHVVVVDAGPDEVALQHRACVVEGVKMYCVTGNNK